MLGYIRKYNMTVHYCVQKYFYPENVAYPLGGERGDTYLFMEMHYDNPDGVEGRLKIKISLYSVCVPMNISAIATL